MEGIGIEKYLKGSVKATGRLGYNPVNMLKTVFLHSHSINSMISFTAASIFSGSMKR